MHLVRVPRSFYLRPTLIVARRLLGKYFCRRISGETLVGRVVEVEAYLGPRDPSSHAYNGKTRRNEVMFLKGGHLYVYFTYGMHFCANVVTESEGKGMAVLLRSLEPVRGIETMAGNRGFKGGESDQFLTKLCSGPARLCQACGIGRSANGTDLLGREIWIAVDANQTTRTRVMKSTRIGISRGKHHHWRFFLENSKFVSRTQTASTSRGATGNPL